MELRLKNDDFLLTYGRLFCDSRYFADEIETRLFPLQSIYDPLQKGKHPQSHSEWLLDQLNKTVIKTVPKDGAVLY